MFLQFSVLELCFGGKAQGCDTCAIPYVGCYVLRIGNKYKSTVLDAAYQHAGHYVIYTEVLWPMKPAFDSVAHIDVTVLLVLGHIASAVPLQLVSVLFIKR